MQTNMFGILVKNAKGLVFSDGSYLYFPDRRCNLHEGIISNIEVVKDFRDTRGYAFITAKNVETDDFTEEDLLTLLDTFQDVKVCNLGDSQLLALTKYNTSDYKWNIISFSVSYSFTSFVCKINGEIITLISGISDRDRGREPYVSLRPRTNMLDDIILKKFCKKKFVGSDDFNSFAQLKVYAELFLSDLERNDLFYCKEYGIIKVVKHLTYVHSIVNSFYAYDGEHLYRVDIDKDCMTKFKFEPLDVKSVQKYALENHICTTGYAYSSEVISNKLISHNFVLGSSLFIVYAFNIKSINFKDLDDDVLIRLIDMTTSTYLDNLKYVVKRQKLKSIQNYTLNSWYFAS